MYRRIKKDSLQRKCGILDCYSLESILAMISSMHPGEGQVSRTLRISGAQLHSGLVHLSVTSLEMR